MLPLHMNQIDSVDFKLSLEYYIIIGNLLIKIKLRSLLIYYWEEIAQILF